MHMLNSSLDHSHTVPGLYALVPCWSTNNFILEVTSHKNFHTEPSLMTPLLIFNHLSQPHHQKILLHNLKLSFVCNRLIDPYNHRLIPSDVGLVVLPLSSLDPYPFDPFDPFYLLDHTAFTHEACARHRHRGHCCQKIPHKK